MINTIRLFLFLEGVSFSAAALTHFGMLVSGYEHPKARTAETVIAIVLFVGLMLTWIFPQLTRRIGVIVQGFALLGTLVGVFTIAIGVGPRTALDIAYHISIVIVLVLGLVFAGRARINAT